MKEFLPKLTGFILAELIFVFIFSLLIYFIFDMPLGVSFLVSALLNLVIEGIRFKINYFKKMED